MASVPTTKEQAIELLENAGNIRILEHINLSNMEPCNEEVPVNIFYMHGLLCARDPRLDYHFWANFGRNQFHLFTGQSENQCFPGRIFLYYPDLDKVEQSLLSIKEKLAHTKFEVVRFNRGGATTEDYPQEKWHVLMDYEKLDHINTKDPYGNRLTLLKSPKNFWDVTLALGPTLPGGQAESQGMPFIAYPVRPGIVKKIARFYKHYLGAVTIVTSQDKTPNNPDGEELLTVHVKCGPLQSLVFIESESERENQHTYDGHHICIYIDNYKESYFKAFNDQMQWNNVLFFDRCDTWEDALRDQQYRILNIVDPKDKSFVMALEHEIRSVDNFRYQIHKRENAPTTKEEKQA
jgi:hypothetical protein